MYMNDRNSNDLSLFHQSDTNQTKQKSNQNPIPQTPFHARCSRVSIGYGTYEINIGPWVHVLRKPREWNPGQFHARARDVLELEWR